MADQIIFKEFESTDIVAGKPKVTFFPAWSDVTTDIDQTPQAIISNFYINPPQTGSFEGYYYWNVYEQDPTVILDAPAQFAIAFGQTGSIQAGVPSGIYSVDITGNNLGLGSEFNNIYPSFAIYRQMVNTTTEGNSFDNLTYNDAVGNVKTLFTMGNIFVVAIERGRIKDYIDQNTWQLNLSGTNNVYLTAATSSTQNQTAYNVIFGTASGYARASTIGPNTASFGSSCGRFYADKGLIILDVDKLAASGAFDNTARNFFNIAKPDLNNFYTSSLILSSFVASLIGTNISGTAGQASNFSSSALGASYFKARSVERVQSTNYFVRARNNEYNNSTNPTWVSGSSQQVLPIFFDDTKTFVTSIGLYDGFPGQLSTGQLVALAKVSKPIPKDASSEALVRVRLDF